MTRRALIPAALLPVAAAVLTLTAAASQPLDAVSRILGHRFSLTEAERATVAAGFETVRALESPAADGIAAIGAIAISARPGTYLQWAEQFADFDRGSAVQAVHRLSDPPVASDFDGLTLSRDELRELERCRVGSCALQLDADSIRRVAAIDWRQSGAAERATAIVREMMLGVALGYAASGNAGLPHYHDARRATDVEENMAALLDEEAASGRVPAPLLARLRDNAAPDAPAPAASYLYWMTNTFGLKPTTRLNHTVVYRGAPDVMGVIATKQLYATHYFHGALEMRYVVAHPAHDDRFVLVVVTRSRSDGLTGVTGAVIGGAVRRRAIHSLRTYLRFTKDMVEKRERSGWTPSRPR